MARLFYAVPFLLPYEVPADKPDWDFKVYSTGEAMEIAETLTLWTQQVVQWPKPLSKQKTKRLEGLTTTVCQTIGDLWRWRLGTAVGRYHTWVAGEIPPRLHVVHPAFGGLSWHYVYFTDITCCVHASTLLQVEATDKPVLSPLMQLLSGMRKVTNAFVSEDVRRLRAFEQSGCLTELPASSPHPAPVGMVKNIALPLSVVPAGTAAEHNLLFYQRQGFTRLPGDVEKAQ